MKIHPSILLVMTGCQSVNALHSVTPKEFLAQSRAVAAITQLPTTPSATLLPPKANPTWAAVTDTNVAGYNVYYGSNANAFDHVVNTTATNVTIYGLTLGETYFFAASSVAADGRESDLSAVVAFNVPQVLQLHFDIAGTTLLSSTNLATWVQAPGTLLSNDWFVVVDPAKAMEVYRTLK